MFNTAIKVKCKMALQSPSSSQEIDIYGWKGRKPNKKEEISKLYKEKKAKSADSQPTTLLGTNT